MSVSRTRRRYVALTFDSEGYDRSVNWTVLVVGDAGDSAEYVRDRAGGIIRETATPDMWRATREKNLLVLSLSAAWRAYPRAMRAWERLEGQDR